jgi:sporulation protein YlmC with PRC-barrel domain
MEKEMQFKANAEVITTDGDKVGEIDRVVIDPKTDTITHIVIREGFLFTSDKVVPVDWITVTGEDSIVLNASKDKVNTLPDFEETHYVRREDSHYPEDYAPAYYWYPIPATGPFSGRRQRRTPKSRRAPPPTARSRSGKGRRSTARMIGTWATSSASLPIRTRSAPRILSSRQV